MQVAAKVYFTAVERDVTVDFYDLEDRLVYTHRVQKDTTSAVCGCTPQLWTAFRSATHSLDMQIKIQVAEPTDKVIFYQVEGQDIQIFVLPPDQAEELRQLLISIHRASSHIIIETLSDIPPSIFPCDSPPKIKQGPVMISPENVRMPEKHHLLYDTRLDEVIQCPHGEE